MCLLHVLHSGSKKPIHFFEWRIWRLWERLTEIFPGREVYFIGRRLGGASRDRFLLGWRCDHICCVVCCGRVCFYALCFEGQRVTRLFSCFSWFSWLKNKTLQETWERRMSVETMYGNKCMKIN